MKMGRVSAPVKTDKLTDSEKKKLKQANKAKSNPEKSAAKKLKNIAKVSRRGEADVREKEHNDARKEQKLKVSNFDRT